MSDTIADLIAGAGIAGRRLRGVVALLTEGPHPLAELVRATGTDRRRIEAILAALGDDLVDNRIIPARVGHYRELIDYDRLIATELVDPLAHKVAEHAGLVKHLADLIEAAPGPRASLDHVSATAETVVRRALWLDATFDLAGARLLCVGDHDLTSLAVAAVNHRVEIAVVDVDDAVLAHLDRDRVRCLWADLRFGLPASVSEWADLVVTDPPYTPEGVRLFLARGLAGLRDLDHARLVLAYGFGESHPTLGLKVQQAITGLHLTYEQILPGFNRYHGAQAVGSRSDLYVLRPTTRAGKTSSSTNIYTHGAQSLESGSTLAPELAAALREAADDPQAPLLGPAAALATRAGTGRAVAVDLSADPGGWLPRVLIALDAPRLVVLVPNNHPDLANEAAQRALTTLVAARYRLKLRRSTPDSRHAIVEAQRLPVDDRDPVRWVIDRAHGKLGNTWREALIRASGGALTKNEARARIGEAMSDPRLLDVPLADLPRHQLAALFADQGLGNGARDPLPLPRP